MDEYIKYEYPLFRVKYLGKLKGVHAVAGSAPHTMHASSSESWMNSLRGSGGVDRRHGDRSWGGVRERPQPSAREPSASDLASPPFSYNLHNNRYTMSSDKPATRFTAGFPSPQVFTTPAGSSTSSGWGLAAGFPDVCCCLCALSPHSPFRSPLSSHWNSNSSRPKNLLVGQLTVDNEISRIEELERTPVENDAKGQSRQRRENCRHDPERACVNGAVRCEPNRGHC